MIGITYYVYDKGVCLYSCSGAEKCKNKLKEEYPDAVIQTVFEDDFKDWNKIGRYSVFGFLGNFDYEWFFVENGNERDHLRLASNSGFPEILEKLYTEHKIFDLKNKNLSTKTLDNIASDEKWVKMVIKEAMVRHPNVSTKVLIELSEYTGLPDFYVADIAKARLAGFDSLIHDAYPGATEYLKTDQAKSRLRTTLTEYKRCHG